jgi:hypothetical protein
MSLGQADTVMSQGVDRALFLWLLLTSLFGVLAGMPWTVAVLGDSATVLRSAFKRSGVAVPSLWIGNLMSALVFAGAHLPQVAAGGLILLVPVVVFSTSAGMVMGSLFMRFGLASAIVGHFTADLMVYVVPRMVAGAT